MQRVRTTNSAPGPGEYNLDSVNSMAQVGLPSSFLFLKTKISKWQYNLEYHILA